MRRSLRSFDLRLYSHFLFNSLHTVRTLIRGKPDQARDAVTRLSNILRVALESGRRRIIALESEMNVVHSYLVLEGMLV